MAENISSLMNICLLLIPAIFAGLQVDSLEIDKMSSSSKFLLDPLARFTNDILAVTVKNQEKLENVLLSPISIHSALNLVLLGADNQSTTQQELNAALGFGSYTANEITNCHVEYSKVLDEFKNASERALEERKSKKEKEELKGRERLDQGDMFGAYGGLKEPIVDMFTMLVTSKASEASVLPEYAQQIRRLYRSSIDLIDQKVESDVKRVLDLLTEWSKKAEFEEPLMSEQELKKQFTAYVISAIRVEAFWFSAFDERNDTRAFLNEGLSNASQAGLVLTNEDLSGAHFIEFVPDNKAKYPFLSHRWSSLTPDESRSFTELKRLDIQAIQVPLRGDLSFVILEPRELSGAGGELKRLTSQLLEKRQLTDLLELLDKDDAQTSIDRFSFPKFRFENELDLKKTLGALGVKLAFDKRLAEIKQMLSKGVYIDEIKHRAMIEVTESGIKAAGATKVKLLTLESVMMRPAINVDVRSPFMFVLRYKKLPLFVGQLVRI